METLYSRSILETLPDEILLEICKYMLCIEVLQSFCGLNSRITRMITQYRHNVSLYKATFTQSSYVCTSVLPKIGSHIRSLTIDCCYSVLQDDLFNKHFGNKMSLMFPHLQKLSLVMFQNERLVAFLDNLYNLNDLVELHLYELFDINREQQSFVLQKLLQANNHQLTSVIIDDQSSCLSFNHNDCFINILQLRINIKTVADLPFLFAAIPNVHYLDVRIETSDEAPVEFDKIVISPLTYLTDFRLKSSRRCWILQELFILLCQLPILERLSLFISTNDISLVQGNTLLSMFSSTVQQFHYAIYYFYDTQSNQDEAIIASWPPSHPISCIVNDNFIFVYTLPWSFTRQTLYLPTVKTIFSQANSAAGCDRQPEVVEIVINRNFTLSRYLTIMSQYRRIREIIIWMSNRGDAVEGMRV
ncbi:unnamed protein product [Rotaria sp. Silwood2]|nr:unnamed protein product [Rotaria sp. Silwood2]CAF3042141.1 unnamed protein product [Rotaria sp. Silwood2]CAF4154708.1 unnamed protein product [Rotaria sp. Silwood2]